MPCKAPRRNTHGTHFAAILTAILSGVLSTLATHAEVGAASPAILDGLRLAVRTTEGETRPADESALPCPGSDTPNCAPTCRAGGTRMYAPSAPRSSAPTEPVAA